jgi:tetratricopeptide (TPR) repeat protein
LIIPKIEFRLSVILALFFSVSCPPPVQAGPLYDSFLEEFQVGLYLDPDAIDMAGIWPGGLLAAPMVDQSWTGTALELLSNPSRHPRALTFRFLAYLPDNPYGTAADMAEAVGAITGARSAFPAGSPQEVSKGFLRKERWQQAVFELQSTGQAELAADLIRQGLAEEALGLSSREKFVWEMRRRYLLQLATHEVLPLDLPWEAENGLGPYDRGAVWSVWVAHRRAAGLPVLPEELKTRKEAERLAGLRTAHFSSAELEASSFATELKAGLGATLFEKGELARHLRSYPDPPEDFSAQGWWIKGQRFNLRGNAEHYEKLAARQDVHPGWRLDVWRRASEVRLLAGQWEQGLKNLDQALQLAQADAGTRTLRRRLRQWVEQATVLALAQGRTETAWELLDKGDRTFSGEAAEVFREETRHWRQIRTGEKSDSVSTRDVLARKVAAGQARPLQAATGEKGRELKADLLRAADQPLWEIWLRWGIALADPAPLSGQVKSRALSYRAILMDGLENEDPEAMADAVLAASAHRFAGRREILEPFLDKLVDRDVGRLSGWEGRPRPSPVPALLPILRRSQLDMHAALGLALVTGDMRGTLALAYELPSAGLTGAEKQRFLYPLPAEGPIREALLAAESEPALVLAVARNESMFEPAVRSRAGALGWMQIMPFHFRNRGALPGRENWAVPAVSIQLGDRILVENRRRYQGDPYLTVAAYNAGPGAADRWRRQLGGNPSSDIYLAWIGYPETRNYVEKVLIDREIYDWILAGRPVE